jgi:hypothetical protein
MTHSPLTELEIAALARINSGVDGPILRGLLERRLAEVEKNLRTTEGAEMHRTQGRAQELDALVLDLFGARQKLDQQRHAPQKRGAQGATIPWKQLDGPPL